MKIKTLRLTVCIISSFLILSGCAGMPLPGNGMGAADTGSADTGASAADINTRPSSENADEAVSSSSDVKGVVEPLTDPGAAEQLPDDVTENHVADKDDAPQTMPRSDAYDMFIAGEMDVTVINETDDEYSVPQNGTYSYKELLKVLVDGLVLGNETTMDVKYAIFTPSAGMEGDDVMALYLENQDNTFGSWMGFIAYNNGKLEMKYSTDFGYRSFFEIYSNGEAMSGGSGGAGASYSDYLTIMPDSSAKKIYDSAHLYSSWCDDVFYELDPDIDYTQIPEFDASSELEMTRVSKDGKVYICIHTWSQDKFLRDMEESYVQKMVDRGAIVVDEDTISELTANTIDETEDMNWMDLETLRFEF